MLVEIQSGFDEDTSTWNQVGIAATQLNMACVNSFTFPVKVGGWTSAGSAERVIIKLYFSGPMDGIESVGRDGFNVLSFSARSRVSKDAGIRF